VHARSLHAREPGGPTVARRRRCCPVRLGRGVAGRRAVGPRGEGRQWPDARDVRSSGVRQLRSTCEAGEQGRAIGGGVGGGKAAGRGEHGPAKRVPDAEPGRVRVRCAGACAPSRDEGRGCAVHGASAPRRRRSFARGLPGVEPEGGGGRGRGGVAGLRARSRSEPSRSACPCPQGQLPGEAVAAGVDREGGRAAAAARGCRVGGQDRPARRRRGAERRLRGGLPRLLVRIPPRARAARCVGTRWWSGSNARR
jgi:hypothetical protein